MKQITTQHNKHREKGQSLVEVALFLPIFIIILAGLIEVSQLVITQNRVSQAARVSSRFGANGGQNEGMMLVALNTVTQTLLMDAGNWDMWVVRGTVNDAGTAFNEWEFTHVYGISNTVGFTNVNEVDIQTEILTDLQRNITPNNYTTLVGGLRIVGLYTLHDVESILGLESMPWLQGFYSVRGLSYMRQTGETVVQTNGCSAFPIAVHEDIRSVNPPGSGGNPYPNPNDFTGPPTPPTYDSFIYHRADIPLAQAREGDVYRVYNGLGSGNFGWLAWNSALGGSATDTANAMTFPGNSTDYTNAGNCGNNCPTPLYPHLVRGYVNPDDTSDITLHVGDWVLGNTGLSNSGTNRALLDGHATLNRTLRLIVWGESRAQGNNGAYRISGFAVFRLKGYSLTQNWILAEFVRWDTSCGQPIP